ncbi:allantoicase [Dentipellis sp. KUC8613]|nr:allantoicase [Dentipellis sp. KUC8613]
MAYERVDLEHFSDAFSSTTELSSVAIGGQIVSVSDEFFAEAFHLLLVEPAPSLKGQFGPKGALYSGWETRRHNPSYDWAIIKLGTTGTIIGFDIDTTHFNGNEAPQVSVQALKLPDDENSPGPEDSRWIEILPKADLGPSSRHLFKIPETDGVNYVKLNMYPDGGIARFRVYGHVVPLHPAVGEFDVAHVFAGGRVVFTSDQHFGVGSNLILPGRGKDMGDGWETKRSRQPGHKDWVIIKLGTPSLLSHVVIDTAHFKGNFPQYCELHAINSTSDRGASTSAADEWTLVLSETNLGPHREHGLRLENVDDKVFTHVRLTIHPDGGVKRVRVIGRKADAGAPKATQDADASETVKTSTIQDLAASLPPTAPTTRTPRSIPALPLTPEAFAPFGQVIQSYPDIHAAPSPRTSKITPANFGTALKYHKQALLESSYPEGSNATAGISVYRCQPVKGERSAAGEVKAVEVKALERHPYTNQAFIPMGAGERQRYVVVVTKEGEGGTPDLKSMRAFLATEGQGIVYKTGVWHQPMTVLDGPMDLACVETQIGNGDKADCEVIELPEEDVVRVQVV